MKLLFLFLFLIYTNAYAKEYQAYRCEDKLGYPFPCDDRCIKEDKIKYLFKVNVENQVVIKIMKHYLDKTYSSSESLENCKVVDKKNWYCELHSGGRGYEMIEDVYREFPTRLPCGSYACSCAK